MERCLKIIENHLGTYNLKTNNEPQTTNPAQI